MTAGAEQSRLRDRLAEGTRGEIGNATEIAREIIAFPGLLHALIELLDDPDGLVVSHGAHAAMQVSLDRPELFREQVDRLLGLLERSPHWEIGEQLPKILAVQDLSGAQLARFRALLERKLGGRSAIAAASALSALVDLADRGAIDADVARKAHAAALHSPSKALAARARQLEARVRQLG